MDTENVFDSLVRASQGFERREDLVAWLGSQIRGASSSASEVGPFVRALHEVTATRPSGNDLTTTCDFCGKSRSDVRTILTSDRSAICDECAVSAVEAISRRPGYAVIRVAFWAFRVVASIGGIVTYPSRRLAHLPKRAH
jgi:hypothetical protein